MPIWLRNRFTSTISILFSLLPSSGREMKDWLRASGSARSVCADARRILLQYRLQPGSPVAYAWISMAVEQDTESVRDPLSVSLIFRLCKLWLVLRSGTGKWFLSQVGVCSSTDRLADAKWRVFQYERDWGLWIVVGVLPEYYTAFLRFRAPFCCWFSFSSTIIDDKERSHFWSSRIKSTKSTHLRLDHFQKFIGIENESYVLFQTWWKIDSKVLWLCATLWNFIAKVRASTSNGDLLRCQNEFSTASDHNSRVLTSPRSMRISRLHDEEITKQ
jgi:hypothetical protein